jgi:hypothetical protein
MSAAAMLYRLEILLSSHMPAGEAVRWYLNYAKQEDAERWRRRDRTLGGLMRDPSDFPPLGEIGNALADLLGRAHTTAQAGPLGELLAAEWLAGVEIDPEGRMYNEEEDGTDHAFGVVLHVSPPARGLLEALRAATPGFGGAPPASPVPALPADYIRLDGMTHGPLDILAVRAFAFIRGAGRNRITGPVIAERLGLPRDYRVDRMLKKLPDPVRQKIKGKPSTGYFFLGSLADE